MHKYSLGQIIAWWLHGLIQYIREVAPLIAPAREDSPPRFWYDFFDYWEWNYGLKSGGVPGETLLRSWLWGTQQLLGNWVEEVADATSSGFLDLVRRWTGWPLHGFSTFQDWVDAIRSRVGTWVPAFANNLAQGVNLLYNWLPDGIKRGATSWTSWLGSIKDEIERWARATYDAAIADLRGWAEWVRVNALAIHAWWIPAHRWLDDLRRDPYSRVVGWLGPAWSWLASFAGNPRAQIVALLGGNWGLLEAFAGGPLVFWSNLWGQYAGQIGEFWRDPLEFLWNRAERFLTSKW